MDLWQENPGVVLYAADHADIFLDDSTVSFSEVKGMTELNGIGPVKIQNLSRCLSWLQWNPPQVVIERNTPDLLHRPVLLQHRRHIGLF